MTAVYLAAGLASHGRTTQRVDADPQASALAWSEAAGDFPFATVALPVRDLHRRLVEVGQGYAHVVIDTPPGDKTIVRSAALAAELALVPLPTGLIDIDRLAPTLELLTEVEVSNAVQVYFLLTRVRRGTKSAEAARRLLADLELPVMEAEIPLREAYASSFGLLPADLRDYSAVVTALLQYGMAA